MERQWRHRFHLGSGRRRVTGRTRRVPETERRICWTWRVCSCYVRLLSILGRWGRCRPSCYRIWIVLCKLQSRQPFSFDSSDLCSSCCGSCRTLSATYALSSFFTNDSPVPSRPCAVSFETQTPLPRLVLDLHGLWLPCSTSLQTQDACGGDCGCRDHQPPSTNSKDGKLRLGHGPQ